MRAQSVCVRRARPGMTGGDGGLERVRPELATTLARAGFGARERGKAAADQKLVPPRAVLVQQQDRLAGRAGARAQTRGLDLHERHEAVHLGLVGRQLGQDAAQTQRVLAQLRPQPVAAGGGRVALVEDEVDHLEHGGQALGKLGPARYLEGDALLGQRALGAHDALGDGRLRDKEGAGDLVGRQAADQAQGERDAGFGGEHGMTGREDQAQEIVADIVVESGIEVRHRIFALGLRARGPAPRACAR